LLTTYTKELSLASSHQVIIVGAGPAGSTLAYELAVRKIKVLVLERARLPRYKCCAGGLTVKAAELIGVNITGLVDDVVSGAIITFKGNNPYHGNSDSPIMYTVRRETFDYALVKRARRAGADILEGVEARTVQFGSRNVKVSTTMGSFEAEFVAGADGARSLVAKSMGIIKHNAYVVGLACEVKVGEEELVKWRSRIGIDIGRIRGGYGWVFPKSDHLSIGIACPADKAKGLKHIFREYLDSLELGQCTVNRWGAGFLPILVGTPTVARGRAMLLGDAAGLVDPLTGEGIFNAILSAQIGASAVEKALLRGGVELNDYSDALGAIMVPQMKEAFVFSKVLSRLPAKLFKILNQDNKVWKACCGMLRGEMDYVTIRKKVSSLGGLYDFISHI
jgi:geranylgeranyl reductase family protein